MSLRSFDLPSTDVSNNQIPASAPAMPECRPVRKDKRRNDFLHCAARSDRSPPAGCCGLTSVGQATVEQQSREYGCGHDDCAEADPAGAGVAVDGFVAD